MENKKSIPVVSIVGRPNVGKSSLFNRILGERHAVVEEKEGTTRDRIERLVEVKRKKFILVDTGGFEPHGKDEISKLVKIQIEKAIIASDVLLFVCDGEKGLIPLDRDLGVILRKAGKRIMLVINKIDNDRRKDNIPDFYELGLGEPQGISCLHYKGMKSFFREALAVIPEHSEAEIEKERPIKIAICGRPNVGKSSFLNKVLDEERALVHEKPGTTRDSIDTYFKKDGIFFLLVDTAGIRHKRKVKEAVDVYSMMRARSSIDRADLALLMIDGAEGVTADDAKIFDYVKINGKGCAILVNKWDLVKEIETSRYGQAILRKMSEARNCPIAFISAKTGRNVLKAFNLAQAIKSNLELFINAADLRHFLKEIRPENVSVSHKRLRPKFYYMTQISINPPTFIVFMKDPSRVTGFHTSFIENRLRERFPLMGVPVRIFYRRLGRKKESLE